MKNNYCTLFDSGYMTRGLALHESLLSHDPKAHLFIFAFDELSLSVLKELNLQSATIISLEEFEDEDLLKIKKERTRGEYCWTCTPSVIKYSIEKFQLGSCTYLDADLYFFGSPQILLDEIENTSSVLITEHRYAPEYDQTATSGKYCVQFMTFKNDQNGIAVLNWWRDRCIEWCFARFEDGKFGDQKYLDTWTEKFSGVHELKHLGGGVAPWNMIQYNFYSKNEKCYLNNGNEEYPLVFFHYHALKFYQDYYDFGIYKMNQDIVDLIYLPYVKKISDIAKRLKNEGYSFNWSGESGKLFSFSNLRMIIRRALRGKNNFLSRNTKWH